MIASFFRHINEIKEREISLFHLHKLVHTQSYFDAIDQFIANWKTTQWIDVVGVK